jgi:hypothetical protein
MKELLDEVDRFGGKVTWIAIASGWKCVLSGVELPPHSGHGRTGAEALAEVVRFARTLGVLR